MCVSLDTDLSPELDGIDLSGGQWQRLAIARGLYRTNDFIVLDVPIAERLLENLKNSFNVEDAR